MVSVDCPLLDRNSYCSFWDTVPSNRSENVRGRVGTTLNLEAFFWTEWVAGYQLGVFENV